MAEQEAIPEVLKLVGVALGSGGVGVALWQIAPKLFGTWLTGRGAADRRRDDQEEVVRKGQAERLTVVEARVTVLEAALQIATDRANRWEYLCLQARLVAEKLGHDPTKWPP